MINPSQSTKLTLLLAVIFSMLGSSCTRYTAAPKFPIAASPNPAWGQGTAPKKRVKLPKPLAKQAYGQETPLNSAISPDLAVFRS